MPSDSRCTALIVVELQDLPVTNPVRRLHAFYIQLLNKCSKQHLPQLQDLFEIADDDLTEYCLVLLPIPTVTLINFEVLHRGMKIPGSDLASFKFGERYTDHILAVAVEERMMELASCLALRKCRFSRSMSARRDTPDVAVFRAALPVWSADHKLYGIVLTIAPATI